MTVQGPSLSRRIAAPGRDAVSNAGAVAAASISTPQRSAAGRRVAQVVAATGIALATAVGIAFAIRGDAAIAASVVGSVYLTALAASILVERRTA